MKSNLFKIKEGKLDKWFEWGKLLTTKYREEAIETLKEEGLNYEAFCVFKIEEEYYTISMIEGEEKPTNMDRELNQKHKETKKECLEYIGPIEKVYELYNK
ncbi:MAG: hypothetical protein HY005_00635 [Candidatus Staskawiczbacteria bacterium]|nr:hypothetical protein [Candidatus Staskawiczbacteria bacterium]